MEVTEEGQATCDSEVLACGTQFREAQREEPSFKAIWDTDIARRHQQVIHTEVCKQLAQCAVRKGLLYCTEGGKGRR